MVKTETQAANLALLGGELSLDFANTVDWHDSEHPHEWLTNYSDLVAWSRHAGILTDGQAAHLLRQAALRPRDAATVLERAIALREAIFRIFSAVATGLLPTTDDIATLNTALSEALSRLRIVPEGGTFSWEWAGREDALDQMLWPVARSAADLLTSSELNRVRKCEGDPCGWLFIDTSRNHSRRWCDMKSCGNRAKARRHYERRRTSRASTPA